MLKSWPNDKRGEHECNITRRRRLRHVSTLEGFQLSPVDIHIGLGDALLVLPISYDERAPDARAWGDYWGNCHVKIEERYSDTVILIVPEKFLPVPLLGMKKSSESPVHVDYIMTNLRVRIGEKANAGLQKILVQLCHIILDEGLAAGQTNDMYLGHVAVAAVFLGDNSLLREAVEKTRKFWQDDCWFALGGLIDLQGRSIDENGITKTLLKSPTLHVAYQGLTCFYDGSWSRSAGQKDQAKADYWKQWYSDRVIDMLDRFTHCKGEEDAATIIKIVWDLQVPYTPEQRESIDKAAMNFVEKFKEDNKFMKVLTVELLLELSRLDNARLIFLRHLFGIVLEVAISSLDLELCYTYRSSIYSNGVCDSYNDGLIREFYNQALAHGVTSHLLQAIPEHASKVERDKAEGVLLRLIKELLLLVNEDSLELQNCIQSLVKTFIAKTVGEKPLKPENWARPAEVSVGHEDGEDCFVKTLKGWEMECREWERDAEGAKQCLRRLPQEVLKRALGDQYMALGLVKADRSTAEQGKVNQAPEEAESTGRPKRPQGEDLDGARHETTPKRARPSEEEMKD